MEPTTLVCPSCDAEMAYSGELWQVTCIQCGHDLDVQAQLCYLRGTDALAEVQETATRPGKKGRSKEFTQAQMEAMQRAYSAIQEALQGELAESQRWSAVIMLADMARIFAARLMTSGQEATYWATQATYQNARHEYQDLQRKLTKACAGTWQRWRWQLRCKRLTTNMSRLERQLRKMERIVSFVYIPRVPYGMPGGMDALPPQEKQWSGR